MVKNNSRSGIAPASSLEEVVNAAFAMIEEQGYGKFSIRALAEKLGIGTMSVYTYVPSKKQLLFLVIQKMMAEIDNKPKPGEYWEDTLHRTCGSILNVNMMHAHIRLMQMQTQINAPQQHSQSIYYLHTDQGMPESVYESMYSVLRSFLTGFIDKAVARKLELLKQATDEHAGGKWSTISDADTDYEKFHEGLDIIIAGTKTLPGADNWQTWRTPKNPETWRWGKE